MDTEEDTKNTEFTEFGTTTNETDGEGVGEGDGDGGLQVAEMPDLNMDGIMEEAARSSKVEDDVEAAAKAEKRKRLKEARTKRFALEQEVVELPVEEEVEEEEATEAVPEPEPEPEPEQKPRTKKPQPASETEETTQDTYAQDELEAAKLIEAVSEISIVSADSYDDNAVQRKSDFLKLFEMPSFSDISSEQSLPIVGAAATKPQPVPPSPRVSRRSRRSGSRKKSKLLADGEEEATAADTDEKDGKHSDSEESSVSAQIEIDSSDLALDKFKPKEVATVGFGDTAIEIFDTFLDGTEKVPEIRKSELHRIKQKQELDTIVAEFVEQLLGDTVYKYETGLAEMIQRNRFDKNKLYEDLRDTIDACLLEQQKNNYLNVKMVEYHRRNKNFRAFDKLAPKAARLEHQRYIHALYQLDFAKQTAAEAKKKNAYLMSSVLMDLSHIQNLNMDIEEYLETVFTSAFSSKSDAFRRFVDREIRRMQQIRYEISDVRLRLITRKHTLGIIKEVRTLVCSVLFCTSLSTLFSYRESAFWSTSTRTSR